MVPAFLLPAALLLTSGCVLDRTGQSLSETWRREMLLQRTRSENLEAQLGELVTRVDQLEELTRARGQEEIMRMETMEELRTEVANMRGEVELIQHDLGRRVTDGEARADDVAFRLQWLEDRAAQLEENLGLEPTEPPVVEPDEGGDTGAVALEDGGDDTGTEAPGGSGEPVALEEGGAVTDPDELMKLAEQHLAAGKDRAAEAVLERFIDANPEHERLAEARYRHAEAAFNGERYQEAVLRFQTVIDRHKGSAWAPWAMLRQGECFEKQGQADNARLFYEDVVRMWPKSKAAKDARGRL